MKDPGFLPGFIGWVIGFFMAYIFRQINIVVSFPEQLKALKIHGGNYAKVLRENPIPPTDLEWEKLSRKLSEMVKSGSAVFRFNFISRYWICKKITSVIKDIEMHQSLLVLRIGMAAAGKTQTAVEGEVHVSMPPVEKKEVSKNRMGAALPVPAKAEGFFMDAALNSLEVAPAHEVPMSESEANDEVSKHALSATEQKEAPAHAVLGCESEVNDEVPKHARSATEQKEAPAQNLTAHAVWELDAPEAAPAHAVSELEAQEVPTDAVSEVAVQLEEGDTTNRASKNSLQIPSILGNRTDMGAVSVGFPHIQGIWNGLNLIATTRGFDDRFMEILDHINIELSGRKQLASLEDLAMEIERTIPIKIKKGRINCTSDNNGSVVEAWIEQLVEVLGRAYDMNKKYKDRFIYNPKARKRISCLTSEINTLLKLGQVNIILWCFNH